MSFYYTELKSSQAFSTLSSPINYLGFSELIISSHIPDAASRIARAKDRFEQLTESISNYEALFEAQRVQLNLAQSNDDFDMVDAPSEVEPDAMMAQI